MDQEQCSLPKRQEQSETHKKISLKAVIQIYLQLLLVTLFLEVSGVLSGSHVL